MKEIDKPRLEEIAIDIENHAKEADYSLITVGKLLCKARTIFIADQDFGKWRGNRLPWLRNDVASRLMNLWKNGGLQLLQTGIGKTSAELLTAPHVPESAREEALEKTESGETVTVKEAKEMVRKAREEALRKDIAKLQPMLAKLVIDGVISNDVAEEFSLLPEAAQIEIARTYLDKRDEIKRAEDARTWLTVERQKLADANERAMKAISEKEKLEGKVDELADKGSQFLIKQKDKEIKQKDKEIKRKEKELDQLKVDMREDIEKKQGAIIEKRVREEFRDEIATANKAKEDTERKLVIANDSIKTLSDAELAERARAEKAEAELEAALPVEKDAQHARQLGFIIVDLAKNLEKVNSDCAPHQRQQSERMVQELIEVANGFLDSAPGTIDMEII